MHASLVEIVDQLESIGDHVLNSWADERTLLAAFGWNCPALTRHDLAIFPKNLAERIREANPEEISPAIFKQITGIKAQLELLRATTIPQMFVSTGTLQAVPAYMGTIAWVEKAIEPLLGWQNVKETGLVPTKIAARLRGVSASIDGLIPEYEKLADKVKLIENAHAAADALPTDMQTLLAARGQIASIVESATKSDTQIDAKLKDAMKIYDKMMELEKEATNIVNQCGESYRATTSYGLAQAFEKRAKGLSYSMWGWVAGLVAALGSGAWIGSTRIESLLTMLETGTTYTGLIWVQVGLSVMSIGAPLWFAWLATKQIGQRFRLAEDYAFKAAVATAYEGYRREASRIDEAFEAQLFASALTRLDEAPLRLVEETTHGSPWHELISSPAFRDALSNVPALRDKFFEVSKSIMPSRATASEISASLEASKPIAAIETAADAVSQ